MRALTWLIRLILFLVLFGLALNNMTPAVLNLLFGAKLQAPLFMLLLAAFAVGAGAGAVAMLPALLRARRQRLRPGAASKPQPATDDDGLPDGV